jgi:hypothetical protein
MHVLHVQSRGSTRDGTGVHDSIVNQLLTKVSKEVSLLFEYCKINTSFSLPISVLRDDLLFR